MCQPKESDLDLLASDDELIMRDRAGDRGALRSLILKNEKALLSWLKRWTNDDHIVWDLFQNTWMDVLRGLDTYLIGRGFKDWLFAIASNATARYFRMERRHRHASIDRVLEIQGDNTEPYRSVICEEALSKVTKEERQVLMLRFYDVLTFQEIGEKLGTNSSSAYRKVNRALEKLHKIF